MNSLIICEGKTDAILTGYFLMKICNYKFNKKSPKELVINKEKKDNEVFTCYRRGDDNLAIWGVGGKDRFDSALEETYNRLKKYSDSERPYGQIIIVCDRDNESKDEIVLNSFSKVLKDSDLKFLNREAFTGTYKNGFDEEREITTLALIVPEDEHGALETALLKSLKEDTEDREIVEQSEEFISEIKGIASRYIGTPRLELKAKLATVFAVMSPEKVFDHIDSLLVTTVKWEEQKYLKDLFSPVIELIGKEELNI